VAMQADPAGRRQPFSEAEAVLVLRAARNETKASARWLPILLAHTGARLAELCDAGKADVRRDPEAGWYVRIEPSKTRRVKTGWRGARSVPLHGQVLEEGLLEYVAKLPNGSALFPDLKPDGWGSRAGAATKVLGLRLRRLGLEDRRLVAGHSWRHRFKDACRAASPSIPKDVHDALTGHAAGDVGSGYGLGHSLLTLRRAIDRLPWVEL
jgi:integrase